MFGAQGAGFEYQFNGHQYGIESGHGYGSQDLRHDPVTAGMTCQAVLELPQWCWQIRKRSAIAQCARLALDQRDVVLPVIVDLVAIQQARVAGNQYVISYHLDPRRIQAATEPLAGVLTGYRVAVSSHADQAGAGNPRRTLDVTVEGRGHGHHFGPLQLQHLGHAQPAVLRVRKLAPECAAALPEPGIEFLEGVELAVLGVQPDTPATVLHVLFDDALFPT
ncbi:hypothetical protein D3C86_1546900 [compost metagenome]